jgi:pilus assembly protein CpaF
LLRDASVDEVMVNGAGAVWVERGGRLEATEVRFGSAGALRDVVERILAPLGRRVDEAEPLGDARLPEAARRYVVSVWGSKGALSSLVLCDPSRSMICTRV